LKCVAILFYDFSKYPSFSAQVENFLYFPPVFLTEYRNIRERAIKKQQTKTNKRERERESLIADHSLKDIHERAHLKFGLVLLGKI